MWPSSFSFFRHSHVVARLPEYLVVLVPMVIFLVIGRTTEIVKAGGLATPVEFLTNSEVATNVSAIQAGPQLIPRAEISTSLVNAGTAISKLSICANIDLRLCLVRQPSSLYFSHHTSAPCRSILHSSKPPGDGSQAPAYPPRLSSSPCAFRSRSSRTIFSQKSPVPVCHQSGKPVNSQEYSRPCKSAIRIPTSTRARASEPTAGSTSQEYA